MLTISYPFGGMYCVHGLEPEETSHLRISLAISFNGYGLFAIFYCTLRTDAANSSKLPPLGLIHDGSLRLCITIVDSDLETVPSECTTVVAAVKGVEGRVEWRDEPE